ncbi:MAG: hypothetical protein HC875_16730 [Anaerolineales bacterium]|nr:hypothetical protein [Anaerolineales bacterium]
MTVILLASCSPAETPTATPVVTDLTATPAAAATIISTKDTSPLSTPTLRPSTTSTPAKITTTPTLTSTPVDSFASEGDTLPSLSPLATPTPGTPSAVFVVPCTVGVDSLQMRGGPGPNYDSIKTLAAGTRLVALKYTASGSWLLVETTQHEAGWVNTAAVVCRGDLSRLPVAQGVGDPATSVPSPAATPLPTATPRPAFPTPTPTTAASPTLPAPSLGSWRGEYYNNSNLTGEPVLVRDDPALDFNWGPGSPDPNVPTDNFSVRWTRPFEFAEEGDYRFWADVDDGGKLYLDGWLIIDEWNTNPYVLHSGIFADIKPGTHTLMVEFFEAAGDAHAKVWFEKTIVSGNKWVGEYFNNPDFRSPPFLIREDDDIDFDWDDDEPAPGMPDDNFSVRWQRTVVLKAGDYNFEARIGEEDRVKLYLDDWPILEEDSDDGGTATGSFDDVGAGTHTIRVEYQDFSEEARIEIDWDRDD